MTVPGVGQVTANRIAGLASNEAELGQLATLARQLADRLGDISKAPEQERAKKAKDHAAELVRLSNTYISTIERLGLKGPYYG